MKKLALLLLLLVPNPAIAGEWGLGLRALAERVEPEGGGANGIDMAGAGLIVRWRISGLFGLELGLDGVRGELDGGAYVRETSAATLAATFHLTPRSRWDLYLLAGLGAATDKVSFLDAGGMQVDEEIKETLLRLGGGVEFRWEHLGIGAELAGVAWFRNDPDGPPATVPTRSGGGQFSLFASLYF
jgi:hypothetical protein